MNPSKQEEDQEAFLPRTYEDADLSDDGSARNPRARSGWKAYLRVFVEVLMGVVILGFLFPPVKSMVKSSAAAESAVPTCMFLYPICLICLMF